MNAFLVSTSEIVECPTSQWIGKRLYMCTGCTR